MCVPPGLLDSRGGDFGTVEGTYARSFREDRECSCVEGTLTVLFNTCFDCIIEHFVEMAYLIRCWTSFGSFYIVPTHWNYDIIIIDASRQGIKGPLSSK